jgi:hypothetical protein
VHYVGAEGIRLKVCHLRVDRPHPPPPAVGCLPGSEVGRGGGNLAKVGGLVRSPVGWGVHVSLKVQGWRTRCGGVGREVLTLLEPSCAMTQSE